MKQGDAPPLQECYILIPVVRLNFSFNFVLVFSSFFCIMLQVILYS